MVLGDNIYFGPGFGNKLNSVVERKQGATVFGYRVTDPQRFGVIEFDQNYNVLSIEEKPARPRSNWAITGLYFYDEQVVELSRQVKPSARGELEITSLNQMYLEQGKLNVELLGRGFAWLDTGTHESLIDASLYIHTIEKRQGLKIACLEEIAYRKGWLNKEQVLTQAKRLEKNSYGQYLLQLLEERP